MCILAGVCARCSSLSMVVWIYALQRDCSVEAYGNPSAAVLHPALLQMTWTCIRTALSALTLFQLCTTWSILVELIKSGFWPGRRVPALISSVNVPLSELQKWDIGTTVFRQSTIWTVGSLGWYNDVLQFGLFDLCSTQPASKGWPCPCVSRVPPGGLPRFAGAYESWNMAT